MHHSIRSHPTITSTLLDFLCRVTTFFFDLSSSSPPPPPNSQLYDRGCDLFLAQNNNFQTYSWPWTVSGSLESLYILPLKYFPWVKQTNAIREILVYGKIPKWILLDIVCILNIIFQNEIDVVILSKCERNNFTLFLWNKCSHNLQIYVDQGT